MGIQSIFIENLKYYRKQKGLSQKDLSIMLDKSFNYINSIEGGVSFPTPAVIDKIAEILKIETGVLFAQNQCPQNINNEFKRKYAKSIESELIEKISKAVKSVCSQIEK